MTSTYLRKYAHSHVVTLVIAQHPVRKTGVQKRLQRLDSGFRRNDVKGDNVATNFDR